MSRIAVVWILPLLLLASTLVSLYFILSISLLFLSSVWKVTVIYSFQSLICGLDVSILPFISSTYILCIFYISHFFLVLSFLPPMKQLALARKKQQWNALLCMLIRWPWGLDVEKPPSRVASPHLPSSALHASAGVLSCPGLSLEDQVQGRHHSSGGSREMATYSRVLAWEISRTEIQQATVSGVTKASNRT